MIILPVKSKTQAHELKIGFTLVEMLVVIVIIASLAAIAIGATAKMKKRGEAAKSVMNLHQIGPLLMNYATEHSSSFPAMRSQLPDGKGGTTQGLHWHQVLASQLYPDLDPELLKNDKWWEKNKPVLRNPLYSQRLKPLTLVHWHQGYAMNRQIMSNLGYNGSWDTVDGPNAQDLRLSKIPDQARTPIVAPRVKDWHYAGSELSEKDNQGFIVDDKLPILFVDGHIETMRPSEYLARKLDTMPLKNP